MLKIDLDSKDFTKWLRWFKWSYSRLRAANRLYLISPSMVFKTKHGYHIYFFGYCYSESIETMELNKNILEYLLGSDPKKQLYFYIEGNDILFKTKNNFSEKYDIYRTKKLNFWISKINESGFYYTRFTMKV